MALKAMDHVSMVVEDLPPAIEFFTELGMEIEGQAPIAGEAVDRLNGIDGIRVDIVMMRTPDGLGKLELTKFHSPAAAIVELDAPPNTIGLRSVMFVVDDIDDTVARLRTRGGELIGELVQYEDSYRLCYLRGPAGIIVALAQELSETS